MTGTDVNKQDLQDQNAWNKWQIWSTNHPTLSYFLAILVIILLLILLAIIYWALFPNNAPYWTGFRETDHPVVTGKSPSKTLWDWLGLLIIPLFLAIGAGLIGRAQQNREMLAREFDRQLAEEARQNEWAIEIDRQEQALVEQYYTRMTELLLDYDLRASSKDDEIRYIARATTLGVFRGINATRKGQVLQFLYEAHLINTPDPIVNLEGADLQEVTLETADFHKAHLAGTDMHKAKLNHANLAGSNLSGTNLISAELRKADLKKAKLPEAYLSGAHLREADLNSAVLTNVLLNDANLILADLRKADLSAANLVGADLSQAKLEGANFSDAKIRPAKTADDAPGKSLIVSEATYNTTTTWPEDFNPTEQGAVETK